jgi:hypothetical protein
VAFLSPAAALANVAKAADLTAAAPLVAFAILAALAFVSRPEVAEFGVEAKQLTRRRAKNISYLFVLFIVTEFGNDSTVLQ